MNKVIVVFELSDYYYDLISRSLNRSDKFEVYNILMRHLINNPNIDIKL